MSRASTTAILAAIIVGACSGGASSPQPNAAAVSPAPAGAANTPLAVASLPAPTLAVSPTPTPTATPRTFASAFYRYRITFPSAAWLATAAKTEWDGAAVIEAPGPYVDLAVGPASYEFVAYGAPTTLGLDAWTALGQRHVADWHGCPATAEKTAEVTVDGVPARLHAFHCGGVWDQKVFLVHDGFGLVLSELGPPGTEAADTTDFLQLLRGVSLTR